MDVLISMGSIVALIVVSLIIVVWAGQRQARSRKQPVPIRGRPNGARDLGYYYRSRTRSARLRWYIHGK